MLATPPRITALETGPCYVKLLVPNGAAGALIGKQGKNLATLEEETSCVLRLSGNHVFFPGTSERVMAIAGEKENVQNAISVVLDQSQKAADLPGQAPREQPFTTKIVVPRTSVAAVIGKGGGAIKNIQETTSTKLHVSSRDEMAFNERIVIVQGVLENVVEASKSIAEMLQEDENLKSHMFLQYPLHQAPGTAGPATAMAPSHMGNFYPGPAAHHQQPSLYPTEILNQLCEIIVQVPDSHMGAVIGRSGSNLQEIITATNASIHVSQRGDFVKGTEDRTIVIQGQAHAVHAAHLILLTRISEGNATATGDRPTLPRFSGARNRPSSASGDATR